MSAPLFSKSWPVHLEMAILLLLLVVAHLLKNMLLIADGARRRAYPSEKLIKWRKRKLCGSILSPDSRPRRPAELAIVTLTFKTINHTLMT